MHSCCLLLYSLCLLGNFPKAVEDQRWILQLRWIRVDVYDRTQWVFISNQTRPLYPYAVPGHLIVRSLSERSDRQDGSLDLMIRYKFDGAAAMSHIVRNYCIKSLGADGSRAINRIQLEILHTQSNDKDKKLSDHLILPRDFLRTAAYGWWMEISLVLKERNSDFEF